jgi:hypothetical protein
MRPSEACLRRQTVTRTYKDQGLGLKILCSFLALVIPSSRQPSRTGVWIIGYLPAWSNEPVARNCLAISALLNSRVLTGTCRLVTRAGSETLRSLRAGGQHAGADSTEREGCMMASCSLTATGWYESISR